MIDSLRLYILILERGGMAAAGRELGLSPATVSARLAALEEHFGVRLLNRTTRALSPTSEGLALLEGARRVLAELQEVDARVRLGADHLAGSIRLSSPVDLGKRWLVPLLDGFLAQHPALRVDLHLSDGYVDLASGGYDLALRYGTPHDSTMRVRKLAEVRRVVCAAPSYLARAGEPQTPDALVEHSCILMRFGEEPDHHWPFVVEGKAHRVTVRGARTSNDGEQVRLWCLGGHGIARKSQADIGADLRAGRLVRLLAGFEAEPVMLALVSPGGRAPSRRVRLLMDHLAAARDSLCLDAALAAPGG